jgi:phage shock protein C
MEKKKKLVRSNNRIFGGVLGGVAEYFGVDATMVRVCYVTLSILSAAFPGLLLYIIMLLLVPEKGPNDDIEEAEVVK